MVGWVRVGHNPKKNVLTVTLSETLLPVLPRVLARVRVLFDLHCDPHAVYEILSLEGSIENHLGPLGITAARAQTIRELAKAWVWGEIDFELCTNPESEMKKLMSIRGIGNWTAQYIAMRAMQWPDAFLETDAGIKKALPSCTAGELLQKAEAWRPWRSYATVALWNSL